MTTSLDPKSFSKYNQCLSSSDGNVVVDTKPLGMRKNGKRWIAPKKAFRPGSGLTSYEKRAKGRVARATMKAKEKELKQEKEIERQARIKVLKERREAKAEKERYEQLAARMHKKRVERLKRKEKRNKLLNS